MEYPPSEKAIRNYCGGTYRGAIDQLDYIADMGFNAIWISPIPLNIDTETIYGVGWHGYWLNHLYQLNAYFGSEKDLVDFIKAAHKRDIWIMLDVVANHVGPNVTKNYLPFDQYEHYHQPLCFIKDYNNQTQVEYCSIGNEELPLPDLNTENSFVVSTFLSWIEQTIRKYNFDGIRIDTFRHVRKSFWKDYIRSAGVYSLGEVATSNTSYVGKYQFVADGVIHYPLYYALKSVFTDNDQTRKSMTTLEQQVQQNELYFKDTTLCGTFLDNHDQDRFLSYTQDRLRIQNALVYLMFSDGIPIVYMGTEQNFTGNPFVKNGAGDPWNREALWRTGYDRSNWIYSFIKKLNQIRLLLKQIYGETFFRAHQQTLAVDQYTYVYKKGPLIVIVSNQSFQKSKYISLPCKIQCNEWKDLLSGKVYQVNRSNLFRIDNGSPKLLLSVA
ncbi:unnamed protein product [Adineta ricciae]|uniref:alpha-amylase n=1 Tax=Adineta ricciae TaxID=249248 RepID=A0A814KLW1_ADIRI|nr:unnamed protein product [Adineta ricciae]CAF1115777.1 unnamed protein product [Adineta ricciae]